MRHGNCFRRRLSAHHADAAPHSAVAELGVVAHMSRARRIGDWLVVALVVYCIGYWLLMMRDLPSVGRDGKFEFRSSPRVGPGVTVNEGITIVHGRTSVLSYLFYPADVVYYGVRDAMRGHKHEG